MYYLNSFRPLCHTKTGRLALERHELPPFIDASCRREPDFQSTFPSISALCRGRAFAPRLKEGDGIIYLTVKSEYPPVQFQHWRIVALLRVKRRFESHRDAASWYREQGVPLPSNCLVEGNNCLPFEMRAGPNPPDQFGDPTDTEQVLRKWDASYKLRMRKYGTFLACETEFLELHQPPILTREMMLEIFGRIPSTQTPPRISEQQFIAITAVATKPT